MRGCYGTLFRLPFRLSEIGSGGSDVEGWFEVLTEDVDPAFAAHWHPGTAAFPTTCPLCGQAHHTCKFAADSMVCVRTPCLNPHHRLSIVDIPF